MIHIHETAIIHPKANIAGNVEIGAYSIIGENVTLAKGVKIHNHVNIEGITTIDENTNIYPFASIGTQPQDLKYKGEPTLLTIGKNNTIREHVTINTGTEGGGCVTKVGDNNLFMVGVHIGHDCQIGDNTIFANNATLAGHVTVENYAVLGGLCAVHQFCRIGELAMVGGMTGVEHDVIPFGMVMGNRASLKGLNLIGLERAGYAKDSIHALRNAYKDLFNINAQENFDARLTQISAQKHDPLVQKVLDFLKSNSKRRFVMP
jgi:UDP-N-acetylglucosamine acyltransferase